MRNRPIPTIALATVLMIPLSSLSPGAQIQRAPEIKAENQEIICEVMEDFEDEGLGVRVIIFHQRDKADGPRLGSLLLAHSGKEMELEAPRGRRYRASVFRVKSCFGRGLVLVQTNKLKLAKHDIFTLRLLHEN